MKTFRARIICVLCAFAAMVSAGDQTARPERDHVLRIMHRATEFMFDTLSNRGGFVWLYTMDLEPYGELKARPSMIWVEPPSTPSVGIVMLEAHRATDDPYYLECARRVADALAAGQHPSGGWNYFIDFDPDGVQAYYDAFFSKCWGWQEYLKKRDNCTFDDYSTTEPTRFVLRLYTLTKDDAHKAVLDRALDHILRAQYSHGGWPQRFPLENDYTACATLNDDVTLDCILLLWEAAETLGRTDLRTASRNGMDFYLRSQLKAPQAGWAQQYEKTMNPAWGRPFEIGTVCATQTHSNILDLFRFYGMTGDAKYLEPIPAALDWLDSAQIPGADGFTHTCFYEMETNRPIYIKQTGSTVIKYAPTYDEEGCYPYAHRVTIPVDALRMELARLKEMPPEAAMAAFEAEDAKKSMPKLVRGHYLALALGKTDQSDAGVASLMGALDKRGGWRDEVSLLDPFAPFTAPPRTIEAYTVGGYIARMYRIVEWLNTQS